MQIPYAMKRGVMAVFLTFAFVLQGTTSVLAGTTGAISGTVVDASTNQPIAAAQITAASPSQSQTTTSDATGHYAFLSLNPDTYTISVAASGNHDVFSVSGVTVQADQTITVSLAQPPKLKVIGSVTSRSAAALVKPGTTADVYSISALSQDKSAAVGGGGNLNTAWSAVATVPGVFVAPNQAGYIGAGASLSIRGGDYDQIGYEFDGVPVNRSFDNYPSGPASSLGQQELQVYTGAAPSNSEAQGISGYINQVIRTGTAPAYRELDAAIGGPALYNRIALEAGGANPARTFSYYLGAGAYNQNLRYADPFNGASLQQDWGVPLGSCPGGPTFNNVSAPGCYSRSGADFTNGGATPAYVLGPFQLGSQSTVIARDSVLNLHFGIPQKNGNRDDVQLLYDNNFIGSPFYGSTNDSGGAAFLNNLGLGPYTYLDSYQYNGATGVALPANYQALTQRYLYPGSPTGRALNDLIDPNQRDAFTNNQNIFKAQYQKNFGSNAYLRVYGYTYYSNWLQNGPNFLNYNFIGPVSPDYELNSHTRGVSLQFADQINSQHLISILGSYTTANSTRDNNTQMLNGSSRPNQRSVFAALVDSTNPYAGICYNATTFAAAPCVQGGAINSAGAGFATLKQAANGTIVTPAGTCGGGPCEWLVVGNGLAATYNRVVPKFSAFSITDNWKPSDRLTVNFGLRFDRFEFDGSNTQGTAARTFWYNAFNADNCVTAGGQLEPRVTPGGACASAGAKPANFTNPLDQVQAYNNWQPRVGATFTLNPRTVLRASYGRYVEAPNAAFQQYDTLQQDVPLTIYGTYGFQAFGFTTPNHEVRAPFSNNYDFSLEHQFGQDWSVKLSPFYRRTQDQIQQFFLNQQTNFVSGLNVGQQTSQGIELEVDKGDFARNGLAGRLSFSYTNSQIRYNRLQNGSSIIDPLNASIRSFNAYTSFCASNPADPRCAGGATSTGVAASPCYVAGAPSSCAVAGAVSNPYWNYPVQGLLDPNAQYATFDIFPGGIGSSYQTFGAPFVGTLVVQYKHGPLAVTPALQFIGGQRYGAPNNTPGVAPETCTAIIAAAAATDPRYQFGSPGGGAYDATSCAGSLSVPDQFTRQFDGLGAFVAPSQLLLHTQISYAVNPRLSLVANFSNLYNHCFGGTKVGFAVSGACGYSIISPSGVAPVGNVYNPGMAIQPILATPYQPIFGSYLSGGGTTAGSLPFSFGLEARLKL